MGQRGMGLKNDTSRKRSARREVMGEHMKDTSELPPCGCGCTVTRIGAAIRDCRREYGLTQQALAVRAGINMKYLSRIEQGKVNITLETLRMLTNALPACMGCLLIDGMPVDKDMQAICGSLAHLLGAQKRTKLRQIRSFIENVLELRCESNARPCIQR